MKGVSIKGAPSGLPVSTGEVSGFVLLMKAGVNLPVARLSSPSYVRWRSTIICKPTDGTDRPLLVPLTRTFMSQWVLSTDVTIVGTERVVSALFSEPVVISLPRTYTSTAFILIELSAAPVDWVYDVYGDRQTEFASSVSRNDWSSAVDQLPPPDLSAERGVGWFCLPISDSELVPAISEEGPEFPISMRPHRLFVGSPRSLLIRSVGDPPLSPGAAYVSIHQCSNISDPITRQLTPPCIWISPCRQRVAGYAPGDEQPVHFPRVIDAEGENGLLTSAVRRAQEKFSSLSQRVASNEVLLSGAPSSEPPMRQLSWPVPVASPTYSITIDSITATLELPQKVAWNTLLGRALKNKGITVDSVHFVLSVHNSYGAFAPSGSTSIAAVQSLSTDSVLWRCEDAILRCVPESAYVLLQIRLNLRTVSQTTSCLLGWKIYTLSNGIAGLSLINDGDPAVSQFLACPIIPFSLPLRVGAELSVECVSHAESELLRTGTIARTGTAKLAQTNYLQATNGITIGLDTVAGDTIFGENDICISDSFLLRVVIDSFTLSVAVSDPDCRPGAPLVVEAFVSGGMAAASGKTKIASISGYTFTLADQLLLDLPITRPVGSSVVRITISTALRTLAHSQLSLSMGDVASGRPSLAEGKLYPAFWQCLYAGNTGSISVQLQYPDLPLTQPLVAQPDLLSTVHGGQSLLISSTAASVAADPYVLLAQVKQLPFAFDARLASNSLDAWDLFDSFVRSSPEALESTVRMASKTVSNETVTSLPSDALAAASVAVLGIGRSTPLTISFAVSTVPSDKALRPGVYYLRLSHSSIPDAELAAAFKPASPTDTMFRTGDSATLVRPLTQPLSYTFTVLSPAVRAGCVTLPFRVCLDPRECPSLCSLPAPDGLLTATVYPDSGDLTTPASSGVALAIAILELRPKMIPDASLLLPAPISLTLLSKQRFVFNLLRRHTNIISTIWPAMAPSENPHGSSDILAEVPRSTTLRAQFDVIGLENDDGPAQPNLLGLSSLPAPITATVHDDPNADSLYVSFALSSPRTPVELRGLLSITDTEFRLIRQFAVTIRFTQTAILECRPCQAVVWEGYIPPLGPSALSTISTMPSGGVFSGPSVIVVTTSPDVQLPGIISLNNDSAKFSVSFTPLVTGRFFVPVSALLPNGHPLFDILLCIESSHDITASKTFSMSAPGDMVLTRRLAFYNTLPQQRRLRIRSSCPRVQPVEPEIDAAASADVSVPIRFFPRSPLSARRVRIFVGDDTDFDTFDIVLTPK